MSSLKGEQAVVIGAGMGGLSAAQALSDHFEHVTLLERDTLPADVEPRHGTPQARHTHVLLAGGFNALTELFPGFETDLGGLGAIKIQAGLDIRTERPGFDPFPQRDIGIETFCLSRPLLEFAVRRRVERQQNISLLARHRATELIASSDHAAVVGVRYEDPRGQVKTLAADLIVDASGRGGLTLALLNAIGVPKLEVSEIGIEQAYSTAIFEIPDFTPTWKAVITLPTPPSSGRGAFIFPIENGRWIVSLGGNHGDAPPGDIDGYLTFASQLRTRTVYDAVKSAKRVGEIVRFVLPSSVRRHFEKLLHFPRGFVPIGDAICRFNPVFGQGMSVAAREAAILNQLLSAQRGQSDLFEGLAANYFVEIQDVLASPWAVALTDFAYPQTTGQPPEDIRQRFQYGAALTRLAAEDPDVHKLVAEVAHLLKPANLLREPAVADRVSALI